LNIQFPIDPHRRLIWASAASPGSVHDLTAARVHGIVGAARAGTPLTQPPDDHRPGNS
jgi:hypothetical protein